MREEGGAPGPKGGQISLSDPFEWPPGWRVKVRANGDIQVDFRLTRRRVVFYSVLIFLGASMIGGTLFEGWRMPVYVHGLAILLSAGWLVWLERTSLFPERLVVGRDRLDVLRGFFLSPKLVASFGSGPIDVIDVVQEVDDRGDRDDRMDGLLCVQIPAQFIGEPFVIYEGLGRDVVWVARLIAQETGWSLYMTPGVGGRTERTSPESAPQRQTR